MYQLRLEHYIGFYMPATLNKKNSAKHQLGGVLI